MKSFSKTLRSFIGLISLSLMLVALVACQTQTQTQVQQEKETSVVAQSSETTKKKVAVTTSFLYDMVKEIAQDKVELALVIPAGADPHIYEPQVSDKEKIETADLVLYHGLHFEGKLSDILENKGVAVSKDFSKESILKMEEDGETVIDPHFWFNIPLYIQASKTAGESLAQLLPDDKAFIESNVKAYVAQLENLDKEIQESLSVLPKDKRFLVTPHDAFFYFASSYGFEVYAPQGVSTEAEADVKSIKETVDFIVKNEVKAIFAESTTNPENMMKLQEEAKRQGFEVKLVSGEGQELFSDSLAPEGEEGDSYIEMYKHNVRLIVENLK